MKREFIRRVGYDDGYGKKNKFLKKKSVNYIGWKKNELCLEKERMKESGAKGKEL